MSGAEPEDADDVGDLTETDFFERARWAATGEPFSALVRDEARQRRYEAAHAEGRAWAAGHLTVENEGVAADELRELAHGDAPAAYVALRTGRLPGLFHAIDAKHDEESDLSEGFFDGAIEVLDERRRELAPPSPPRRARRKVKTWRP